MLKHRGGEKVKGGFYWKTSNWEIVTLNGRHGTLPGDEKTGYVKIPFLLLVPVALVMSIAYVVFLPFVGFAMIFGFAGHKAAKKMKLTGPVTAPKHETVASSSKHQ
jgi:hypothetical protein